MQIVGHTHSLQSIIVFITEVLFAQIEEKKLQNYAVLRLYFDKIYVITKYIKYSKAKWIVFLRKSKLSL